MRPTAGRKVRASLWWQVASVAGMGWVRGQELEAGARKGLIWQSLPPKYSKGGALLSIKLRKTFQYKN